MPNKFNLIINHEYVNNKKIFVTHCTNLGIASQGKTLKESLKNIKDAIKLYLEENPNINQN